MKKLVILSITILAVTGLVSTAFAAVSATLHDVPSLGAQGVCSACHIPHKAAGKRLWPADMGSATASNGEVGSLCWYCHGTSGLVTAAQTPYPFKSEKTYTHGLVKANLPDGTSAIETGFPYAGTTNSTMQCTTCHDVHNTTTEYNPFLRDDTDELCARCHPNRQYAGGSFQALEGTWGSNYGTANPGSHPVGTDVYTDASDAGNSPINQTAIGIVTYYYASNSHHNLGAHLIDGIATTWQSGNGMGCVTCHTVHGTAVEGGGTTKDPAPSVLAWDQGYPGNGVGTAADFLCETCHRAGLGGYSGTFFPNPGNATRYTHPVDDYFPSGTEDFGVTLATINNLSWPSATGSGAPNILCESCHMPHPRAAMTVARQVDPLASSGTHILRDTEDLICQDCHSGSTWRAGHHPTGNGLLDGTLFKDDDISAAGTVDSDLTCGDCHNNSGAHNWATQGGVGLDPNWEPFDNGRTSEAETARTVASTSKECMDCHYAQASTAGRFSPTRGTSTNTYYENGQTGGSDGSHWMGSFNASGWSLVAPTYSAAIGGTRNFTTEPFSSTGYSRFGGTAMSAAEFVCESCHELEPSKNVDLTPLLLWNFSDGIVESRSAFCEACHSQAGASGNPHPMTSDTITKAQGVNRSTLTLITSGGAWTPANSTGTFADVAPGTGRYVGTGYATYPAANQMNCDSCHQVHNADTQSGSFILEGNSAGTSVTGATLGSITIYGLTIQNADLSTGGTMDFRVFCGECHGTGIY